ncbi:glycosyltransferase [Streptomyces anulatus]
MTNTITATRRRRGLLLAGTAAMAVIALTLSAYGLRTWLTARGVSSGPALWAWTPLAILLLAQTALYLCERPHRAHAQGQEHLDGLHVAVLVPVFKEDNGYLRATLSSLLAQTRPPDSVHIADDGSEISHRAVRRWWAAASREHRIPTSWHRTPNRGKRHAQVLAARQCPRADVFVTVDSDAQLAPDALHEVLQPLADPRVQCAPAPSPLLMAVPPPADRRPDPALPRPAPLRPAPALPARHLGPVPPGHALVLDRPAPPAPVRRRHLLEDRLGHPPERTGAEVHLAPTGTTRPAAT